MELRQLRMFVAVAEAGSVTAAASRLYIAQPALSRQISSLERELGHRLFTRGPGGVVLTEAGTRLLAHARVLLDDASKAVADVGRPSGTRNGALRIGVNSDTAARVMPYLLRGNEEPHAPTIRFVSGLDEELLRLLDEGEIDAAVVWWTEPGRVTNSQLLFTEDAVAVLPPEHQLLEFQAVTPEMVGGTSRIAMFDPRLGAAAFDALASQFRGDLHDPRLLIASGQGGRAQASMVGLALAEGAATVVTAYNWRSWLATPRLSVRHLDAPPAPISLVWNDDDAVGGLPWSLRRLTIAHSPIVSPFPLAQRLPPAQRLGTALAA